MGCNGGTDLAYGGGTFVAAAIAHSLEDRGHEVFMVSVVGLDRQRLVSAFGWPLGPRVIVRFLYDGDTNPRIPHLVAQELVGAFAGLVKALKPDVVIYNDDPPASLRDAVRSTEARTLAYVHFPYQAREAYPRLLFSTVEWSYVESFVNFVGLRWSISPLEDLDMILANSKATAAAARAVTGRQDVAVLNPPLPPRAWDVDLGDRTRGIVLHAARQDRTFMAGPLSDFIVRFMSAHPDRLVLVNRNKSNKIASLSARQKRLLVCESLPASLWARALGLTKYYLHFRWFEGFGISTAEAVAGGAIPVVFRSPFNGTATDIVGPCSGSCLFSTVEEALQLVEDYERNPPMLSEISCKLREALRRNCDYLHFSDYINRIVEGGR